MSFSRACMLNEESAVWLKNLKEHANAKESSSSPCKFLNKTHPLSHLTKLFKARVHEIPLAHY